MWLLALLVGVSAGFSNSSEWIMLHYNECNSPHTKHFRGETLGYITPWNKDGWSLAIQYAKKLDYVAPVWYQINIADDGFIEITGEGNSTWTGEMTRANPAVKVLPRVILEKTSKKAYTTLLDSDNQISSLASLLIDFAKKNTFPGLTFEVWMAGMMIFEREDFEESMALQIRMIEKVAKAFKRAGLLLILPVPPPRNYQSNDFDASVFLRLSEYVHRFSLMSYDFSTGMAGPNSPLVWFEGIVDFLLSKFDAEELEESEAEVQYTRLLRKILMGLPFYGYKFTPLDNDDKRRMKTHEAEAIIAPDYLDLLNEVKPVLEWMDKYEEHAFSYTEGGKKIEVYYPTQTMLHTRIDSARRLGVGLAIWDLGQGFDLFFDLL